MSQRFELENLFLFFSSFFPLVGPTIFKVPARDARRSLLKAAPRAAGAGAEALTVAPSQTIHAPPCGQLVATQG